MNKTINITERNIFEGEKANPQNCAIARAIKKNMKGKVTSISVLPSHVNMKIKNKNIVGDAQDDINRIRCHLI